MKVRKYLSAKPASPQRPRPPAALSCKLLSELPRARGEQRAWVAIIKDILQQTPEEIAISCQCLRQRSPCKISPLLPHPISLVGPIIMSGLQPPNAAPGCSLSSGSYHLTHTHPGLGQGAKHTSWVQSEIERYTGGYLWHEWVMGAAPQPHCHLTLLTGVS